MASDLSPGICDPSEEGIYAELAVAVERVDGLLRRAVASELPLSELAPQVLSVIQERVASAQQDPDEIASLQFANDTPGLECMGWALWDTVDKLAREDERHHDALIAFINAFFPLLRTQPWSIWNTELQSSTFLLGATFRESIQPFDPTEQGVNGWVNFCRFVARMTRDTEHDFSNFLLWFAMDALEDCSWSKPCNPDTSVLAFEGVVEVCGAQMFRSKQEFGGAGSGGKYGARKWTGKRGFCRKRWLFWENGLLDIARDETRPVHVRDSAQRTAAKMKSIRGEIEHT